MSDVAGPHGRLSDWRPQKHSYVVESWYGDEVLLWGPHVAIPQLLSPVRAAIWSFLDGEVSAAALADDLSDALGASHEQARAELEAQLRDWVDAELVELPELPRSPLPDGVVDGPGPEVVLASPAVRPSPMVNSLVATHHTAAICVRIGEVAFAVLVESDDLALELTQRLGDAVVERASRWRFALIQLRENGTSPHLLLTDTALPLALTEDRDVALRCLLSEISHLADLQTSSGVGWLRAVSIVRGQQAVLLQPEFLFARPELSDGLATRGWDIESSAHTAIDATDGSVVLYERRGSFPKIGDTPRPPVERDRYALAATILCGAAGEAVAVPTKGARVWQACLLSAIGHEPRVDSVEERIAAAEHVARKPMELTRSFEPSDVLTVLDQL